MPKYTVHFEGSVDVEIDSRNEDEIFDRAYDLIYGDARTRLDANASIDLFEIIDEEEDDE